MPLRERAKLSAYCQIKDFTEPALIVNSNLHRSERSLLSHLLCGIFPLVIETGRYRRTDREERFVKYVVKRRWRMKYTWCSDVEN